MKTCALLVLAGCAAAAPQTPGFPVPPPPPPEDAAQVSALVPVEDAPVAADAAADAPAAPASAEPEVWLKGSTHVHARPSGDSSEPIDKVVAWYETRGYDFIALTDHNRVTELDPSHPTGNQVAIRAPAKGLIVLAGIELTHNPVGCLPPGDKSRKCRIHVNALGVTARPDGKLEWAERHSHERIDMYAAALRKAHELGAHVVQINHPQWYWGMTPDVLVAVAQQGARLVEIANVQFGKWNAGDKDHLATEALWDAALARGALLWGVASDDAHDYEGHGKYPAGGGWIVVKARREPQAILDAIAAGRFYASTGVVLARADVDAGDLVVEVAPGEAGNYAIEWVENGKLVETVRGRSARRAVPAKGYVRAVVVRDDGKRAWVQPARL